ncbi:GNAT family N-acetyltransferase [Vibrio sp. SCSIO 43135]|uniref:GNAT family N-acetyltransferase n=1 Tax=Vibrio sp. SCSIO 43135 TaxID=2819096 RepID=UPI002075F0C6|nr:GNAT family N-acetyltransferase [Vibrio sp. SCSIO 43135]USD42794.1 GNAT family N-acetyltransferase [Vibrio sp. SCSIO 43135]
MIRTERLLLTPVTADDLDIYVELLTCAETTRYLPGGEPFSLKYIEDYVPKKVSHWAENGFGTFIVSLVEQPEIKIGYSGVEILEQVSLCDIRYGLLPKYQGHGYAYEAAKATLDYVFENKLVDEVYGVAVTDNQASLNLLKKLGMTASNACLYDSNDLITMSIKRR